MLQDKFVIAMDNYFTLPCAIKELRDKGIGVVGTARFKQGWPPAPLQDLNLKTINFDNFYWMIDKYGTLVACWMDNGLVFLVSTVHTVGNIVTRSRTKPRETGLNKRHVDLVWGTIVRAMIAIPTLIDHYNHWMGGVDLVDQRVAYYHSNYAAGVTGSHSSSRFCP